MTNIDLALGHVAVAVPDRDLSIAPSDSYSPLEGLSGLRELIASWESTDPLEVAITTGASLGILSVLSTLERPGSVLCPRPYYPGYPRMIEALGLTANYYGLKEEDLWLPNPDSFDYLVRRDTRAVILNFPGNPTGAVPPERFYERLNEVLRDRNLLIVCDLVYSNFLYGRHSMKGHLEHFGKDTTVRVHSFSKTFAMPGERVGYVIADRTLIRNISQRHWALALSAPVASQKMAMAALAGDPQAAIARIKKTLAGNRSTIRRMALGHRSFSLNDPGGGCFFWIKVPRSPFDSRSLASLCAATTGVLVSPGQDFGVSDSVFLRASFAVRPRTAKVGFARLFTFLSSLSSIHEGFRDSNSLL